jgi:lysophospholipase L1-like esterase
MPRRRTLLALGAACLLAYLSLAWFELVPGGWRLRNLFEPHQAREARRQQEYRAARLRAFEQEAPLSPRPVVFLGSSTIERFPLEASFPGRACLNRGVAFEDSRLLRERLDVGVPADAAGFVLYVASIDLRFQNASAEAVAVALRETVSSLRNAHGQVPIAVIGLLSERSLDPEGVARLARANAALASEAERLGCSFVSTTVAPLTTESGQLARSLSSDELHLSPAGYAVLSERLLSDGGALGELLRP